MKKLIGHIRLRNLTHRSSPTLDYEEVMGIVLKWILNASAILGVPLVAIGVSEAIYLGQPSAAIQYIVIFLPILVAAGLRPKLGDKISAGILLICVFLLCSVNIYLYGFSGAGLPLFYFLFVLTTLFLGYKTGLIVVVCSIIPMGLVGYWMTSYRLALDVDLMQISRYPISWITATAMMIVLGSIMIISIGLIQNNLLGTIALNNKHAQELNETNEKLVRDISERKRVERELHKLTKNLDRIVLERTQELQDTHQQLVEKEKMATLGLLGGGVAHELRNPLGVISNAVYFLTETLTDAGDTTKEYLKLISSEVERSTLIINSLLSFSHEEESFTRMKVPVKDLIVQALERQAPPKAVQVSAEIPEDLTPVFVDPSQITRVLDNLITNAYQAMPDGGKLTISARAAKDTVALSILDTGSGIPEKGISKIFEPLFTTKARGIGLGLAITKKLLEINGGAIEVQSEEGVGSTFTVILPTKDGDA